MQTHFATAEAGAYLWWTLNRLVAFRRALCKSTPPTISDSNQHITTQYPSDLLDSSMSSWWKFECPQRHTCSITGELAGLSAFPREEFSGALFSSFRTRNTQHRPERHTLHFPRRWLSPSRLKITCSSTSGKVDKQPICQQLLCTTARHAAESRLRTFWDSLEGRCLQDGVDVPPNVFGADVD